ncbi:MAG: DEAD/DEAH box helicase family protein [Chloroflexota bacterium]|nr:DEAD/DEAH box helicase family protein [Chloroflexota bacterium]
MAPPYIENPILNSPFREPERHFKFDEDGITSEIVDERRRSTYFIPIAQPKRKVAKGVPQEQLTLPGNWTAERMQENDNINRIRAHVAGWRQANYPGITATTRELLSYWTEEDRDKPLFFCQIEALETAIYLTEVAGREQQWIENLLREEANKKSGGLYRVAFKMATGAGKTVVMAMLIAWQSLNKLNDPHDKRFSDTFLIVTPGITIRDRLRVLKPNAPDNYYEERDLLTSDLFQRLQAATVVITNYHSFVRRDKFGASITTKKVLAGPGGDMDRFKETEGEMVRRVLRSIGNKKNVVVLNDEAHHCYQAAASNEELPVPKMTGEEKKEVEEANKAAHVWLSGLRAVQRKIGVRSVFDLSATPFFLRGSGYQEGTLFPWVVSDFSLIDAIESGIVKIPRVPTSDDVMDGDLPTFRDLWVRIRDELPKRGRDVTVDASDPRLPKELEAALIHLYGNYEKSFHLWAEATDHDRGTPPVFIVVCSNTTVSKMVFDWIAGYQQTDASGNDAIRSGNLKLFSNAEGGNWRERPNTLLIDSAELESGESMDANFKKIAAREIEEFKDEALRRGERPEDITDEDLLREVMNTIGKKGKLGEQIRCVVSVSMLTEGWDANTVTHILGVRAFGTQLLCEQVVGRGLRRISYEANEHGMFEPEYAEVFGVPFSFIPTVGTTKPVTQKPIHRVYALPERKGLEISFPRVIGYRWDMPTEHLEAQFTPDSTLTLRTDEVPTRAQLDPIVGESIETTLDELKEYRRQQVAFALAKRVVENYLLDAEQRPKPWLFPQVLPIVDQWMRESVVKQGNAFEQMLLITQYSHAAAEKIQSAIVRGTAGIKRLLPILRPYDAMGSTSDVDFNTTRTVYTTAKSHLNYCVEDSGWESKIGDTLDHMDEVLAWFKNPGVLRIPYTHEGAQGHYVPDFVVRIDDGRPDPLNLVIEVTGERKKDKVAKVDAASTYWVPAVNNLGEFGRWGLTEVTDPWDAADLIAMTVRDISLSNQPVTEG